MEDPKPGREPGGGWRQMVPAGGALVSRPFPLYPIHAPEKSAV